MTDDLKTEVGEAGARLRALVATIVQQVAELPDRTSPDDWPDAMLVTSDELTNILLDALLSAPVVSPPQADWLAERDQLIAQQRATFDSENAKAEQRIKTCACDGKGPPSLALLLLHELRAYLSTMVITSENIGNIRRACFMPWDSQWNGIVRDETAEREQSPPVVTQEGESPCP